jgi:hypothetical protein
MRKLSLFILLFFHVYLFGQLWPKSNSAYINSYTDKIILKANLSSQTDSYYKIDNASGQKSIITPNDGLRLSLSLDYEFIGVSIGWAPELLPRNNDDELKGKSSFNNYEFRVFLGHWVQLFHHNRVSGFYIQNTDDLNPNWIIGQDPFIQLPNLKTTNWNLSTSYVLNPNFSLKNRVYQTEWQRKSSQSFIPTFNVGFSKISDRDGNFVTVENNHDVDLSLGFYHTAVIKGHWYVSPFISPSLGLRISKYEDIVNGKSTNTNDLHFLKSIRGGLQLGYSASRIIYGITLDFNVDWFGENEKTTVINDKIYGKVFWGCRLNSPKFIQKPFNWIKSIAN